MDSHEGRCTAARAALLTGELEMADLHLRAARSLAESPQHRAEVLVMQIRLAVLQGDVDGLLVAEALGFVGEIADAAPVVAGEVLLEVVVLELYGEHGGVVDRAHRARQLVASSDDPILQARADVLLGLARAFTGSVTEAETLLARSLDLIRLGGPPDEVAHTLQQVVVGLAGREMYAEAAALCRRSIRAARAVGAVGLLPLMLCFLANTVYFVGEFAEQEMAAAEALGLAAASGQLQLVTYAKVCRGVAMAVRGDTETARRDLEAALVELDETGGRTFRNLTLMGLALLEFSAADWPRAVEGYARLRRNWERDSTIPGILHWRGDEIEALWRSGDHKAARDRLAELIADATEYGPWEQAVIARLEGLTGAPASAEARFAEALEWHARGTSPFEEARTRLCWGEWLLSQGHPTRARRHLEQARDRFGELDTPLWRARTERLLAEADASHPETLPRRSVPSRHRVVAFGPLTVTGPEGTPVRVALDTPGNLLRLLVVEGGSVRAEHAVDRLWPTPRWPTAGHGCARYCPGLVAGTARWSPARARCCAGPTASTSTPTGSRRCIVASPRSVPGPKQPRSPARRSRCTAKTC